MNAAVLRYRYDNRPFGAVFSCNGDNTGACADMARSIFGACIFSV